jgi:hypothetical protein
VINFFFLQIIDLSQLLDLVDLHADVVDLDAEIGQVLIDTVQFDLFRLLHQLTQGGKGTLDSLDAHIIVHLLPHQSGLRIGLGLFTDGQRVQFADVTQVVEHVRLVVA